MFGNVKRILESTRVLGGVSAVGPLACALAYRDPALLPKHCLGMNLHPKKSQCPMNAGGGRRASAGALGGPAQQQLEPGGQHLLQARRCGRQSSHPARHGPAQLLRGRVRAAGHAAHRHQLRRRAVAVARPARQLPG